ncbi:MAG: UDP-N-acetylglucosamine 2-epimerase (non-hydrolyzing) [Candidatus Nezhaarchaeota archaeon]|nr:UDP-N-acetylglucosamine 2-epimerase (non-hydrolyzing) [Candidatus Nezhaarchaeota archaeon]
MRPAMVVAGTRPELIKLAPVLRGLDEAGVDYVFVWSGQHYDYLLSQVFFEEFGLDGADVDLGVGSGSHAQQAGQIMAGLEGLIGDYKPSLVVAEGDTNTVLAAALSAVKCHVPFAHVEAGLRSWNMLMPEEVNRRVADAVASLHFAPTEWAALNLLFEGVSSRSVHVTGNTIVDAVGRFMPRVEEQAGKVLEKHGLERGGYLLVTLHRAENTDNPERLRGVVEALMELAKRFRVVFPLHPRTRKMLDGLGLLGQLEDAVMLMEPLGYFEFLALLANCLVALTDSGGVQEEAFTLKVPTVTLRYNTERPETTMHGVNVLAGAEAHKIVECTVRQAERAGEIRRLSFENPLGDGEAGRRITQIIRKAVESGLAIVEPDLRETPMVVYRLLEADAISSPEVFDLLASFDHDGKSHLPSGTRGKLLARLKICW